MAKEKIIIPGRWLRRISLELDGYSLYKIDRIQRVEGSEDLVWHDIVTYHADKRAFSVDVERFSNLSSLQGVPVVDNEKEIKFLEKTLKTVRVLHDKKVEDKKTKEEKKKKRIEKNYAQDIQTTL